MNEKDKKAVDKKLSKPAYLPPRPKPKIKKKDIFVLKKKNRK